jgi:hypothetical protein
MHHSYEYGARVIPLGRKTQVTEAVGGELQAPKADGFAWSKFNPGLVVAIVNEGEFR